MDDRPARAYPSIGPGSELNVGNAHLRLQSLGSRGHDVRANLQHPLPAQQHLLPDRFVGGKASHRRRSLLAEVLLTNAQRG